MAANARLDQTRKTHNACYSELQLLSLKIGKTVLISFYYYVVEDDRYWMDTGCSMGCHVRPRFKWEKGSSFAVLIMMLCRIATDTNECSSIHGCKN